MTRRLTLVVAAMAAAVLGAAPSYAAPAPACITFADPKGDTTPSADPSLDITSVSFGSTKKALVGTITVDKAAIRPLLATGNRMELNFTVAGKKVTLFYKSGPARAQEANAFTQQGLRIDDVFITGDTTGVLTGNTLTMSVKYTVLRGAVGGTVLGAPITNLAAQARASYVTHVTNVTWDSAAAKAGSKFLGGAGCR